MIVATGVDRLAISRPSGPIGGDLAQKACSQDINMEVADIGGLGSTTLDIVAVRVRATSALASPTRRPAKDPGEERQGKEVLPAREDSIAEISIPEAPPRIIATDPILVSDGVDESHTRQVHSLLDA